MNDVAKSERLKNIISSDRKENPYKIEKVLKAEIINVLRNYFDINVDDFSISLLMDKNGNFDVQINFLSRKCIIANVFA